MKLLSAALVFIFSIVTSITAFAGAPACRSVFALTFDETPWGQLRPDFNHNNKYTLEIKQEAPIKNQCNLGTCHLHAWLTVLENSYTAKTGQSIPLDNHYESAQHLLKRSIEQLYNKDQKADIALGAGPLPSKMNIQEFGLVPAGVWAPKTEFYVQPNSGKYTEYLENIIARTKLLREQAKTEDEQKAVNKLGEQQIRQLFKAIVGDLPQTFVYDGQTYTPKSFGEAYFKFFEQSWVQVIINVNRKVKSNQTTFKNSDAQITMPLDRVQASAKALLDAGQTVFLSYEHHAEYVDKATGIISIKAFYIPEFAKPLTRQERATFNKNDGGHAVEIVGYDADPITGEIIKWKIKNSWGTKSGDQGYYHMYNDYFRAFAKSITYQRPTATITIQMNKPTQQ
ncbi:C1 family peptidase [Bdellovibrio sp. NC01]|uniref:C1 family peptidase n=1 Tax=Bdellovibrio sp. NC01 TaxID=2220073 RepID=UPI00115973FA|nr:C1 family peptidase [Bdellovibrio sp. NC01]QDK38312.1 aminopeptidase [Bdellovibrio sp. NC01]